MTSDNGIFFVELEQELLERLATMGVVYKCTDSECCTGYHLTPGMEWCDVDLAMIQLEMDEREW